MDNINSKTIIETYQEETLYYNTTKSDEKPLILIPLEPRKSNTLVIGTSGKGMGFYHKMSLIEQEIKNQNVRKLR